MKSKVFLIISLSLLFAHSIQTAACVWFVYSPKDYRMFRSGDEYCTEDGFNYNAKKNCRLWKAQTGTNASLGDIYEVVYKMSAEEMTRRIQQKDTLNNFIQTLRSDREATAVLLLAKQCEAVRGTMTSPWYYPSRNDPYRRALEEIVWRAKLYENDRFHTRYALQVVRALMTLNRYDDCINYWTGVAPTLENDIIYKMSLRYVAGAYFNLGEEETAKHLYGEAGDTQSLIWCAEKKANTINTLEEIYRYYPEAPELRSTVAFWIQRAEIEVQDEHIYGDEREFESLKLSIGTSCTLEELKTFCLKVASEGEVSDINYWYYAASYMEYLSGNEKRAYQTILKAERSHGSEYCKESIHVLKIYLYSLLTPWTDKYAAQMVEQLRWLDEKIVKDSHIVKNDNILSDLIGHYSFYYWNDMMRKIVLSSVCPKLISNRQEAMAIAFANMADNRLLSLVSITDSSSDSPISMDQYRELREYNYYDWRNNLFTMLDTLRIDCLEQYLRMIENPRAGVEHYLYERSYVDPNYFRDIIGTRMLREMKYQEAEKLLKSMTPSFQYRLNTYRGANMKIDPFSLQGARIAMDDDYKYNYAREMAALERGIAGASDPDRKALMMLKMAIGMKNSVECCWPLTFYGRSFMDGAEGDYHLPSRFTRASKMIMAHADSLFNEAHWTARDMEIRAQIQLTLMNHQTVMKWYPDTEAAEFIRGHCDRYVDYHLESKKRPAWVPGREIDFLYRS